MKGPWPGDKLDSHVTSIQSLNVAYATARCASEI